METNIDSPKYQGQRNQMVSKLESLGINDKNVLLALNNVPRHLFMDPGLISHSYKNNAYPIESGQTISQPYTVAFQTQLIKCKKNPKLPECQKQQKRKGLGKFSLVAGNLKAAKTWSADNPIVGLGRSPGRKVRWQS